MAKGDRDEARMMQAMIGGFVFAGLQRLDEILAPPITWDRCDADGHVDFTLASGMKVHIKVNVYPLADDPGPQR